MLRERVLFPTGLAKLGLSVDSSHCFKLHRRHEEKKRTKRWEDVKRRREESNDADSII